MNISAEFLYFSTFNLYIIIYSDIYEKASKFIRFVLFFVNCV